MSGWPAAELRLIDGSDELFIAVDRADGTPRRSLPIWVVCVGDQVFVRTWYRRDAGWFAQALTSGRARIRVPGLEAAVTVVDVGAAGGRRAAIDAAYEVKYGRYGGPTVERMVSEAAAATTLRLSRVHAGPPGRIEGNE